MPDSDAPYIAGRDKIPQDTHYAPAIDPRDPRYTTDPSGERRRIDVQPSADDQEVQ